MVGGAITTSIKLSPTPAMKKPKPTANTYVVYFLYEKENSYRKMFLRFRAHQAKRWTEEFKPSSTQGEDILFMAREAMTNYLVSIVEGDADINYLEEAEAWRKRAGFTAGA